MSHKKKPPPPKVGMEVCDCRFEHHKIIHIAGDDITLDDGFVCSYKFCTDSVNHSWPHPPKHGLEKEHFNG